MASPSVSLNEHYISFCIFLYASYLGKLIPIFFNKKLFTEEEIKIKNEFKKTTLDERIKYVTATNGQ